MASVSNNPKPNPQQPLVPVDIEDPHASNFNYVQNFTNATQLGALRKIYSILTIQLLITFGIVYLFMTSTELQDFALNSALGTVCLVLSCITIPIVMIVIACNMKAAAQVPINYILLFTYTFAQGYLLGFICAPMEPAVVICAAVITLGVTFGLTFWACVTKDSEEPSIGRGALWIITTSILVMTPLVVTTELGFWSYFLSFWVMIAYGFYIYIDTLAIIHDKLQNVDHYVLACLILYQDIIVLFVRILEVIGKLKK